MNIRPRKVLTKRRVRGRENREKEQGKASNKKLYKGREKRKRGEL